MSDVVLGRREMSVGTVLGTAILVFIAWDLYMDFRNGNAWLHLAAESVVLVFTGVGIVRIWGLLTVARSAARVLGRDLDVARSEARRWRSEASALLRGLSAAIDRQFERWSLTPAESEIGLLLLKGLSHKEIARVRDTSERTVRQQARSLYTKAGLSGRSELSAFFLEDLLLPHPVSET